jgi:bacterial/archaeal transporter family-2 protein
MIFAIPVILGIAVVLQGVLNRKIGSAIGLSTAVFINALVFLILSAALLTASYFKPNLFPEFLRIPSTPWKNAIDQSGASVWLYWVPGLCGFLLVLGVPFAIQSIGPSKTFVILVSAQIAFSVLLEAASQSDLSPWKFLGAALAITGAYLVAMK